MRRLLWLDLRQIRKEKAAAKKTNDLWGDYVRVASVFLLSNIRNTPAMPTKVKPLLH